MTFDQSMLTVVGVGLAVAVASALLARLLAVRVRDLSAGRNRGDHAGPALWARVRKTQGRANLLAVLATLAACSAIVAAAALAVSQ